MHTTVPNLLADYLHQSRVALSLASADADNPLLFVNTAFCTLTGFTMEEVVGKNCRLLQGDAPNAEARAKLRSFIEIPDQHDIRTPIINFRKDGSPFVNLLYMSRLRSLGGKTRYIFASQFDVSRSRPELLTEYDATLATTLGGMAPIAGKAGIVVEGTLLTIANSAATIAQAKMMLGDLERFVRTAPGQLRGGAPAVQ